MSWTLNGHPSYPLAYSRYRDISPDTFFLITVPYPCITRLGRRESFWSRAFFKQWFFSLVCSTPYIDMDTHPEAWTFLPVWHRCILPSFILSDTGSLYYESWSAVQFVSLRPWAGLIVSDRMLPYSLGCSLTEVLSGIWVTRTGQYRPTLWVAFAISAVGFGVMYMLDGTSSTYVYKMGKDRCLTWMTRVEKVIYPLIAALGLGCLFGVSQEGRGVCAAAVDGLLRYRWSAFKLQCPSKTWQRARPRMGFSGKNIAWFYYDKATWSIRLYRIIGGTVGVSAGQAIFSSVGPVIYVFYDVYKFLNQAIRRKIKQIPNVSIDDTSPGGLSIKKLKDITVSAVQGRRVFWVILDWHWIRRMLCSAKRS